MNELGKTVSAQPIALDPVFSEKQLLEWIGVSSPTLSRWRANGEGPPYVQLGPRRIGYLKSGVEQWLADCERNSRTCNDASSAATGRLQLRSTDT